MHDLSNRPQFCGVLASAANIGGGHGSYTAEQFRADCPQFFRADGTPLLPSTMLDEVIRMVNAAISPERWLDGTRFAQSLYTAHLVTLLLRTYTPSNETAASAAASGALVGAVKSATLGDASVTYDTASVLSGTADWGDLNATTYGQMLASRARLVGAAGSYVI